MDGRRARLIESLIEHLESMDADELKGKMPQPEVEVIAAIDPKKAADVEKGFKGALGGPKMAMAEGGEMEMDPQGGQEIPGGDHEEMDDDEFAEMLKLSE